MPQKFYLDKFYCMHR